MMNERKKIFFSTIILIILILPSFFSSILLADQNKKLHLEKLYLDAKFTYIVEQYNSGKFKNLTFKENLIIIKSLARIGHGGLALKKLKPLLVKYASSVDVLTASGIVNISLGRLNEANSHIDRALEIDKNSHRAILAKVVCLMFCQQYGKAEAWYEKLSRKKSDWSDSYLAYLVGIDLYRASRNSLEIMDLYNKKSKMVKKSNRKYYKDLRANYRLYQRAKKGKLFDVETVSDKIVLPLVKRRWRMRFSYFTLKVKDKEYKVILDTGNASGWMIHNRELKEYFNAERGGNTLVRIGSEAGLLDGYNVFSKKVNFGDFSINNLIGVYVPKPYPRFFDANLNPIFIRNRVFTIDFVKQNVVIRTKQRFDKDLLSSSYKKISKLPWYGYKNAFVPVEIRDKGGGLAIIETGAEDIALKLDFARVIGLDLKPKKKYLASGKVSEYFVTPVKITMGTIQFQRKAAEVWPMDRFYNRLTGYTSDVVLGPKALRQKYILSFDPFDKKIILVEQ